MISCGCLIALITYGLRTSFGLFAAPVTEGRGWSPEVFAFFSHQVGAFLGVWLGGVAYEQTGSFAPIWWAGIALAVIAAAIHLPIAERRAPRFAASPQPGA